MKNPFRTIATEKIRVGRFSIVQDKVLVNEHEQEYDYLEVREGVCILPIKEGELIIQKQYRYPIASWEWEFPGGFIDDGETASEAAIRELKEETGYDVSRIEALGVFYPSFGSTNERIYLFFAECSEKGKDEREVGEVLSVQKMKMSDFVELVRNGEFRHGAGLAAWARCSATLKLKNKGENGFTPIFTPM